MRRSWTATAAIEQKRDGPNKCENHEEDADDVPNFCYVEVLQGVVADSGSPVLRRVGTRRDRRHCAAVRTHVPGACVGWQRDGEEQRESGDEAGPLCGKSTPP